MWIKSYLQSFPFCSFVRCHKSISMKRRCVYGRIWPITNSKKLFHTNMFLINKFKLKQLGLISKIILINMLVVENTRINIEKLVTWNILVIDNRMIRYFYIMDSDMVHFYIMSIILCWKRIGKLSKLSSEMTATQW